VVPEVPRQGGRLRQGGAEALTQPRIGTAGWAIPRGVAEHFPTEGTGLERYAARFDCAEINSTFYRSHRPGTLARWAASVPEHFRFAVKAPKAITHERRLVGAEALLARFLHETAELGEKRGPVLVQLPPSLAFDAEVARGFFRTLRGLHDGGVACEPRHASWFDPEADTLLRELEVARVAADPAKVWAAAEPGGWTGLRYWRLHGSPRMYYSAYDEAYLETLARTLAASEAPAWCVFDNTTSGAAAANALALRERLTAR
jgi:uncharacterized protein YecE (DUF72 family)